MLEQARWLVMLVAWLGMSVQAQVAGPAYDAATIKPADPASRDDSWNTKNNRMTLKNVTLRQLVKVAYGFRSDAQVIGGPEWVGKAHFNIEARMDDEEFVRYDKLTGKEKERESRLLMLHLLEERFHLRVQEGTRPLPQFALVVDGAESKLVEPPAGKGIEGQHLSVHNGQLQAKGVPMESFAGMLSDMDEAEGRVVVDHTGLKGLYTFELKWTPDRGAGTAEEATQPGLFTALREQLGLKLVRGEGDVPVVVVEGADVPVFD